MTATLPRLAATPPAPRSPKLTRLEVVGFKSFATRTVFAFEPGITAVVGPNGSGKSNVADAVRWVLGEQGAGALRARKTEDVIFAGGQGRAPAGFAEATLTFDNAEGWLPIDFAEVAITRRAERGGDNQYLINGRRVRLKDVAQLTAGLGQSHVVVGQGLVDAALSQKPEERRALFEHAADLAGLRLKVAETSRNLTEAESNSARVGDLLADLEPRLKTMERQARQAREWQTGRDELRALQTAHLAGLLRAAEAALTSARRAEADAEQAAVEGLAAVEAAQAGGAAARAAATAAREALAGHDARRRSLDDRGRRIRHERDLAGERTAALDRRRQDMLDTAAGLESQAAAAASDLERLAADLAALDEELAAAREAARALRAETEAARAAWAAGEQAIAALDRARGEAERRRAELAQTQAVRRQQAENAAAERERLRAAGTERGSRIAALDAEIAVAERGADEDAAALAALDRRLAALGGVEREAAAAEQAAAAAVANGERALHEAQARLAALRRLHDAGAGLYAGVKETLGAARAGKLAGVLGVVAELIAAPAELDTAIEVALGGHLQDVVVRRWRDAEAAITHLKRTGAGRATFQPLETVSGRRGSPAPGAPAPGTPAPGTPAPEAPAPGAASAPGAPSVPQMASALATPGVRGVAADLVGGDVEARPVVEALLGRTLVVEDLPTARAVLPGLPGGWSAVTLAGEIARSGGSVTGGAAVRESGVLGRERELRGLPAEVARLDGALATARQAREEAAARATAVVAERRAHEAERAARTAAGEERARQRQRLAGWLADLRGEQAQADARAAALERDAVAADADLARTGEVLAALEQSLADLGERRAAAERARATAAGEAAGRDRAAAAAGQRLAALEERLRAERRREAAVRGRAEAVAAERRTRAERIAALDRERAALAVEADKLAVDAGALERERAALEALREPLEAALGTAEAEATGGERRLETARAALLDRERAHGLAALARERAEGERAALARRIDDDLALDDPAALLLGADGGGAPVFAAGVPVFDADDPAEVAAREKEIARLKERLRRIGYVGEDAVADYEREAERVAFLRAQLDDIAGAAAALKGLLADLERTMRQRFEETFARVAEAFAAVFTDLFGGGTAKLVLVGSEGGAGEPGIDVVAQPPGKRLQNLALLSGGERALTAAALLFAILRVNPAPFCLLDEVDAALDESNVVRVREQLRALADQTQVIVITHNRGTIETADTLYGVTMAADGVSKVLSMRLTEAAVAE
jgi:chromosome segregation protein